MPDATLSQARASLSRQAEGWAAPTPDNWMQGRTTYGGYSAGMLLEATLRNHPDLPPLRSALVNFTGPVTGPFLVTSELLRQGRNVSTVDARARIDGQTVATASFAFGTAQDSDISVESTGPAAPAPEDTEFLIPPQAASFAPKFHHQFDIRLIEGDRPLSGSNRAYIRGWARHQDPQARSGSVPLLCIADALPPAVFPLFRRLGPNSSMNWICNFLDDDPQTEDGWWQVETQAVAARGGYSSQVMRMWNTDGKLVVEGMQSVVVFV